MTYRIAARRLTRCMMLIAAAGIMHSAQAASLRDEVAVDFPAEIDRVAGIPERFAIELPFTAGVTTRGTWSTSGNLRIWQWEVRVPGAVSLSFHAGRASLPAGALLSVSGGGREYRYGPASINRGELWSRIARGDTLTFTLTVSAADVDSVVLDIAGLQAGFRSLGGAGPNHPHYDALRMQSAAGTAPTDCSINYQCMVTTGNAGPGQASVTLIIANLGLCSGVMLNDVAGDGVPYVLTARHCENGSPDGGDPAAALGVSTYFDAVSSCGQGLETIYMANAAAITGAVTLVEQQDAWLIRLDSPPPVMDAYFAGWDATGSAFSGGYTAHYGLGNTRQYTGWYGQAYYAAVPPATLDVQYTSTLWELVNQAGDIAPGASGSGVFDANNHFVGTIVRGEMQSSQPDSAGVCPMATPPIPGPSTATVYATALSGIFNSTADPASTTGNATLRTVLDPQNSGTTVVGGRWMAPLLSASSQTSVTGTPVTLTWGDARATSCSASGGLPGDGWSGTAGPSGSVKVNEYAGGAVTYVVTCSVGPFHSSAQVTVNWSLSAPSVMVSEGPGFTGYIGSFEVDWYSTVAPCVASGGAPGDGWSGAVASSGIKTVTELTQGIYDYAVTCGSGARTASYTLQLYVSGPVATITDNGISSVQVGLPLQLSGSSEGTSCVASGGSPGDGWTTSNISSGRYAVTVSETTPGAYTYVLACAVGSQTSTASLTVNFTNGPPAVTLVTTPAVPIVNNSALSVSWVATVEPCIVSHTGYTSDTSYPLSYYGTIVDGEWVIGPYTYTVTCGTGSNTASASRTVSWTGTPQVTLSASDGFPSQSGWPYVLGTSIGLNWISNVVPCTASGGMPGDGWSGTFGSAESGVAVTEAQAGTYSYAIVCGSGSEAVNATTTMTLTPGPVAATLTASATSAPEGSPVTLTWNSNTSPCLDYGTYGPWNTGTGAHSGSATVTETYPGPANYIIQCGEGLATTATAEVTINWTGPLPPTFTVSPSYVTAGQPFTLTWSSQDGTSCVASGGAPGDGWSGQHPASGSAQIVELAPSNYEYGLTCGIAAPVSVSLSVLPAQFVQPPTLPTYASGQLVIPALTVGNASYVNTVVTPGRLVSGPTGTAPTGSTATYDPATGLLTIPSGLDGTNPVYNVVLTVGSLLSIGSLTGADTFDGVYLSITAVQVPGGQTYRTVVARVAGIVSVGGGMPAESVDQYDPSTGLLTIPAIESGSHVYTNVVLKVASVVSIGG